MFFLIEGNEIDNQRIHGQVDHQDDNTALEYKGDDDVADDDAKDVHV